MNFIAAHNSIIEEDVLIGDGTKIWYFCHIRKRAKIGMNCNIGDHCFIDEGVIIGNDCRIANNTNIYKGAIIKDKVMIGPNVKITNVRKPSISRKAKFLDTIIENNVSIEAGVEIVGGVRIGKGACIAAGSVVITNVPEGSFSAGNPAKDKKKLYEEKNR